MNISTRRLTRRRFCAAAGAAAASASSAAPVASVMTVTGPILPSELGVTLTHEHVIADLRPQVERRPGDYDREDAVRTCLPYLKELRGAGCQTIVEPSPLLVRRDVEALRILSEKSGVQIICSTGVYGALDGRFVPGYAREWSAEQLAERYVRELRHGVKETGVHPGFIKSGVNRETPLPPLERKLVRAAAMAAKTSGRPMGVHTGPAAPVFEQLDLLESAGLPLSRYVWIHAHVEKDGAKMRELARRGVWVSFDGINPENPETLRRILDGVEAMAEAGLLGNTLVSQDAGWFQPGQSSQEKFRGYTSIFTEFLPRLRERGFGQAGIDQLLVENPRRLLQGVRPA